MEERQNSPDTVKYKFPLPPGAAFHDTYVIQVPRDQVYRVPPPEHARIIEKHKRITAEQEAKRRSNFCSYAIPVILIPIIIAIVLVSIRSTVYRPRSPRFTVTHIQGNNLGQKNRGSPQFKLTVHAINRNTAFSVSYGRGEASLVYEDKKIGLGKIKSPSKRSDGESVDFKTVLTGNGAQLSKKLKKKLKDPKEKSMELRIQLPIEMNSWIRNKRMNLKVYCELGVRNSLMNKTKISYQKCTTEY